MIGGVGVNFNSEISKVVDAGGLSQLKPGAVLVFRGEEGAQTPVSYSYSYA
jgi:hypothetical protein